MMFIFHLFLVLLISSSFAGDEHLLWRKVKERYKKINSIQGNFIQRVCSESEGSCEEFSGRFFALKPNLLRIEVEKPKNQLILSDGESLSVFIEKKPISKTPIKETPPFLLFFELLKDSFNIKVTREKNQISILLTPVDTSYYSISLSVNPKNLLIEEIKFTDWEGNKTEISFFKLALNQKLSRNLFKIKP